VTVSFPGPAFSETDKTCAAADLLVDLWFGETSDLYKKLVESEQKIDRLYAFAPRNADPDLIQVFARLKKPEDALFVRDQILKTVARARVSCSRGTRRRGQEERAPRAPPRPRHHRRSPDSSPGSCATAARSTR
jgi:zinc protease